MPITSMTGALELLRAVSAPGGASSERDTGQGQDQRNAGEVPLWHRAPLVQGRDVMREILDVLPP